MVQDVDNLVLCLLENIALRGEQGATFSDLPGLVEKFYRSQAPSKNEQERLHGRPAPSPVTDQRLLARLWTWLTQSQDIIVEKIDPSRSLRSSVPDTFTNKPSTPRNVEQDASNANQSRISENVHEDQVHAHPTGQRTSKPTSTAREPVHKLLRPVAGERAPKFLHPTSLVRNPGYRDDDVNGLILYATEERMWQAITGHAVDRKRVPDKEFQLLSIIAASGESGITQPDLIQMSGQDKRSVPHRTNRLQLHGYIVKHKVVDSVGRRTSACVLAKFTRSNSSRTIEANESSRATIQQLVFENGTLLEEQFLDCTVNLLERSGELSFTEFQQQLSIREHPTETRIVLRNLFFLELAGIVKWIGAPRDSLHQQEPRRSMLRLVKRPTAEERDAFLNRKPEIIPELLTERHIDEGKRDKFQSLNLESLEKDSHLQGTGPQRVLPQWTPEQPLSSLIHDLVEAAGVTGTSTMSLQEQAVGSFSRQPLEHLLGNLTDVWQVSQPSHLRHLAIVRDTAMEDGLRVHYLFRTFPNFRLAVQSGAANSDAVESTYNDFRSTDPDSASELHATLDEWGFPPLTSKYDQQQDGSKTMFEFRRNTASKQKPIDKYSYVPSILIGGDDGSSTYHKRAPKERSNSSAPTASNGPHSPSTNPNNGNKRRGSQASALTSNKRPKLGGGIPSVPGISDQSGKSTAELKLLAFYEPEPEVRPLEPGVHVNPFGHRKPNGRGRPRKKMLLVVKMARLNELHCFNIRRDNEQNEISAPSARGKKRLREASSAPTAIADSNYAAPANELDRRKRARYRAVDLDLQHGLEAPSARLNDTSSSALASASQPARTHIVSSTVSGLTPSTQTAAALCQPHSSASCFQGVPQPKESGRLTLQHDVQECHLATTALVHRPDLTGELQLERLKARPSETRGETTDQLANNEPTQDASVNRIGGIQSEVVEFAPNQKTPSRSRKREGVSLRGGSLGHKRSTLILHLVDQAGGMYPGDREIWYPFATAWQKLYPTSRPDPDTVARAVKTLVDTGKLKKTGFAFKTSSGAMRTKRILLQPDISVNTEQVQDLRLKMQEAWPNYYIPPIPIVDGELRMSAGNFAANLRKSNAKRREPNVAPHTPAQKSVSWSKSRASNHTVQVDIGSSDEDESEMSQEQLQMQGEFQLSGYAHNAIRSQDHSGRRQNVSGLPRPDGTNTNSGGSESWQPSNEVLLDSSMAPRSSAMSGSLLPKIPNFESPRHDQTQATISPHGPSSAPATSPLLGRNAGLGGLKLAKDMYNALMSPLQQFHSASGTFATLLPKPSRRRPLLRIRPELHKEFEQRMPTSLEDLMARQARESGREESKRRDESRVQHEIEQVEEWEVKHENDLTSRQELIEPHFINITAPEDDFRIPDHPDNQRARRQNIRRPSRYRTPPPTGVSKAVAVSRSYAQPLPAATVDLERANDRDTSITSSRTDEAAKKAAPRRPHRLQPKPMPKSSDGHVQVTRLGRKIREFSKTETFDLVAAVLVVQCLAGGVHGAIDWSTVSMLREDRDLELAQVNWDRFYSCHRLQIIKMEKSFQDSFLEAYGSNEMPRMDLDRMKDDDWKFVYDWTRGVLDVSLLEQQPPLPATRNVLESTFALEAFAEVDQARFEALSEPKRETKREEALFELSLSAPLRPLADREKQLSDHCNDMEFSTARSFIRANALTDEASYDAAAAHKRIFPFGEALLRRALRSLIAGHILCHKQLKPDKIGRNFTSTSIYQSISKLNLDMEGHFHGAVRAKELLDACFTSQGYQDLSLDAEDADAVVIADLVSHGRVEVHALLPPTTTDPSVRADFDKGERELPLWGFSHGSYKSKEVTREALEYDVRVVPTDSYVRGVPQVENMASPPAPHLEARRETATGQAKSKRIPLWFDIHDRLIPEMWRLSLASVLTALVLRPGSSAAAIAQTCNGAIEEWEIGLVLEWLGQLGVAERLGTGAAGWIAGEGWWSVLGGAADGMESRPGAAATMPVDGDGSMTVDHDIAHRDELRSL